MDKKLAQHTIANRSRIKELLENIIEYHPVDAGNMDDIEGVLGELQNIGASYVLGADFHYGMKLIKDGELRVLNAMKRWKGKYDLD